MVRRACAFSSSSASTLSFGFGGGADGFVETTDFASASHYMEWMGRLPALLHAATRSPQPDAALKRVLGLLQAVLRRTSYLALLDEQPSALARLVDVLARSALKEALREDFEKVKDERLAELERGRSLEAYTAFVNYLKEKASITYNPDLVASVRP